ncbi:MAG: 3'-5' exoribonuclease, partial [Actinobacteria bacterium]|nr:3'-5' exoribonuclease [Actinomycetota bacterium]
MTQVMIDIETLSTQYNAAILSIGAVKWEESEIVDTFYINVDPKSCKELGLHVEHKTVEWWMKQSA